MKTISAPSHFGARELGAQGQNLLGLGKGKGA